MNCETHCWTGVWYSDKALTLDFPPEWDVTVFRPPTPPPLTDAQISEALERPSGQSPIRQICRGKSRPLVIIDRKSTRLNSSHSQISYAVFCLKKKKVAAIPKPY